MPSALSIALRERGVAALTAGASCHGAAARFGVADVKAARENGFENQDALGPDRLVFLDETAAATNMARA